MLRSRISATDFAALPEILQKEYKKDGDNYVLDSDDASELRTANTRAREERDEYKRRADQLETEKAEQVRLAQEAATAKAKKDKDVEALEASWKTEKETAINIEKANTVRRENQLSELLVENIALQIANEISTSPIIILPHIRARLLADLTGDKAITRVLDLEGKPSAKTLEDLKKEFIDNKDFASIIKGTNGSGGGASGNGSSGGAAHKSLKDMSETERLSMARDNPMRFRELVDASRAG